MNIPQLQEDRTYSRSVGAFLGYNVNPEIGNGENHDEYNLTADEYPLLANRRAQSKLYTTYFSATNDVLGSLVKDNVLYVIRSNGKLYHWGESGGTWQWIEASSTNAPTFAEKQKMVSVGAKICFYPKLYSYNTTNDTWENGSAEVVSWYQDAETHERSFALSTRDGGLLPSRNGSSLTTGTAFPAEGSTNPKDIFINTSTKIAYERNETNTAWDQIDCYVMFFGIESNLFKDFSEGDIVNFSIHEGTPNDDIKWLMGNHRIVKKYDNNKQAVIEAFPNDSNASLNASTQKIKIKRPAPLAFDYVVEHDNRVFGCFYGAATGNQIINEIHASALGEPFNFYKFQGISTDSYTVSLGSDGPFTGAIVYNGYPTFFKENYIHRIFGQYPSNYQLDTLEANGVMSGSGKSLVIVDGVLYYHSAAGFMAYTSGLPVSISSALQGRKYKNVVGAVGTHKAYFNCAEGSDYIKLVYDTSKQIWHKEPSSWMSSGHTLNNVAVFLRYGSVSESNRYHEFISADVQPNWPSSGIESVKDIPWMFESALFGLYIHSTNYKSESLDTNHEYINRLLVKTQLDPDSEMAISISYDGGEYEQIYHIFGHSLRSFDIPIKPRRCEHFRLKFEGKGYVRIYSIVQQIKEGSQKK